jgi:hypothetical protein
VETINIPSSISLLSFYASVETLPIFVILSRVGRARTPELNFQAVSVLGFEFCPGRAFVKNQK